MKKGSKKSLQFSMSESEEEVISNPIDSCEHISDITDQIDKLTEQANNSNKKERKEKLVEAQKLIDTYETHIGRNVYNSLL